MDLLLILLWFLIAMGLLMSLIASSYFVYVRGVRRIDILARFVLSFIVYGLLTTVTGMYAGLIMELGAHAHPPGPILGTGPVIICSVVLLLYAASGWVMCSFIVGRFVPYSAG